MDARPSEKDEIAARFKAFRQKARYTQRSLGRAIGVCRQTICEIEAGLVKPHLRTWEKFCEREAIFNQSLAMESRRLIRGW